MNQNMELIRKLHAGSDSTCFGGILRSWGIDKLKFSESELNKKKQIKQLQISGMSARKIADKLSLHITTVRKHIREYDKYIKQDWLSDANADAMYDRLFPIDTFFKKCEQFMKQEDEDCFFTVNSFWREKKTNNDIRHLNCFVLDFDFYNIQEYAAYTPQEFYVKKIKSRLPYKPTAVVDSGRGLYVLYAFEHCSYHMSKLYVAICKQFYQRYAQYGLDRKAMNLTQVIRLPGTMNCKSLSTVTIIEYNDTEYSIQDFASLLPYTFEDCQAYKADKVAGKHPYCDKALEEKAKRKPYFSKFMDDLKQLIVLRNREKYYEGYREALIFILRERACWSGFTIAESIKVAKQVNECFHEPLTDYEVEHNCTPSSNRSNCSINTIIDKLGIKDHEFDHMKVLRPRWMKKRSYAIKKRRHKLLNMTEKQYQVLSRRTSVCEMKFVKHLRNKEIADLLKINKSTVTRDIAYILENPKKFKQKLSTYMDELEGLRGSYTFTHRLIYDVQQQLLEWLKIGYSALDYLVRDIGVAKN